MKQSVMQYLTQQNLVVTQSFESFVSAMLHLLTLDTEEHDGGEFGFTISNTMLSGKRLPKSIPQDDSLDYYQHTFTFGDCMNPHCIYETVTPSGKRTFYVEKDYLYD